MTKEEKLDHLFEDHHCSNCGQTCGNMGEVCNRWISDQTVYCQIRKQLDGIREKSFTVPIQTIVTGSHKIIAKELA